MAQKRHHPTVLASGGTQADVDAYLGAHPDADPGQMASDAAAWAAPQGDAFGGFAPNVDNAPGGGARSAAPASIGGDTNYAKVFNDPNRRRAEQTAGEFAAMGYSPYGMEEKWSPAPDVKAEALTRQKQGQWQAIVNKEGAVTPERKAQFEADWAKIHPAAPPASGGGGGTDLNGQPFVWGGGGGTGGGGADYGGGGAGSLLGGYELPGSAAASQAMRDLQMGGLKGLQGLMSQDTEAQRGRWRRRSTKPRSAGSIRRRIAPARTCSRARSGAASAPPRSWWSSPGASSRSRATPSRKRLEMRTRAPGPSSAPISPRSWG